MPFYVTAEQQRLTRLKDRERKRLKKLDSEYIAREQERRKKYLGKKTDEQRKAERDKFLCAERHKDKVETAVARGMTPEQIFDAYGNEDLTYDIVKYIVRRQESRADVR